MFENFLRVAQAVMAKHGHLALQRPSSRRRWKEPVAKQLLATAWRWRTVQAYPWRQAQHINAFEFITFLIYIRSLADSTRFHGVRYFHIFDSKVACSYAHFCERLGLY